MKFEFSNIVIAMKVSYFFTFFPVYFIEMGLKLLILIHSWKEMPPFDRLTHCSFIFSFRNITIWHFAINLLQVHFSVPTKRALGNLAQNCKIVARVSCPYWYCSWIYSGLVLVFPLDYHWSSEGKHWTALRLMVRSVLLPLVYTAW